MSACEFFLSRSQEDHYLTLGQPSADPLASMTRATVGVLIELCCARCGHEQNLTLTTRTAELAEATPGTPTPLMNCIKGVTPVRAMIAREIQENGWRTLIHGSGDEMKTDGPICPECSTQIMETLASLVPADRVPR